MASSFIQGWMDFVMEVSSSTAMNWKCMPNVLLNSGTVPGAAS